MKFAKILFYIAAIWGILVITPLFFIFDKIGVQDPPPITHPLFYYGFAGVTLAWQFVFLVIARNPARYRPLMLVSILEKLGYFLPALILYSRHRIHPADLLLSSGDALLAILFLIAYLNTPSSHAS